MRTSEILIFLLFLYLYTPSKAAESCEMIIPKSFDDCKGATSSYGDHCCYGYVSSSNVEYHMCIPFTEAQYKDQETSIEQLRKEYENYLGQLTNFTINCGDGPSPTYSTSKNYCGETKSSPSSFDECKNMDLREGMSYCCHFSSKIQILGNVSEVSLCQPLSLEYYLKKDEMIEETKKQIKDFGGTVYYLNLKCDNEEEKKTDKDEASHSKSKAYCGEDYSSPSSFDACKNMDLREGKSYCCYLSYKFELQGKEKEVSQCQPLSLEEYSKKDKMIEETKKQMEDLGGTVYYLNLKCGEGDGEGGGEDGRETIPERTCSSVEDKKSCLAYNSIRQGSNINEENGHCCYYYHKILKNSIYSEEKKCLSLTEDEYKKIPELIKNSKDLLIKDGGSIAKFSLDCHGENIIKSHYIISSIFALALILF